MTRVVVQVRCHDEAQKARWEAVARGQGLELSAWVRRALDEQAALDGALAREAESVGEAPVLPPSAVRHERGSGAGPVSRLFERRT